MSITKAVFCAGILIWCVMSAQSIDIDYLQMDPDLVIYDQDEMKTSFVTFVEDSNGNKFVVKQCKVEPHFYRPVKSVLEMVALEIGHALHIPLNKACIIPAGVPFVGKERMVPATLHKQVPGLPFDMWEKINHVPWRKYRNLKIKQKKYGGLSKSIMRHMRKHRDLPGLVAFDTFVGNPDRGIGNLFYDDTTDTFYGIDLGGAFSRDLCGSTAKKIRKYRHDTSFKLTHKEWKGVRLYYKTLAKLTKRFTSEKICNMLDHYACHAGLTGDTHMVSGETHTKIVRYFSKCKKIIHSSYASAFELLHELEKLLQQHKHR